MRDASVSIPIVKISLDGSDFNSLIDKVVSDLKLDIDPNRLPGELRQRLVNFLEAPAQLFRIYTESGVAGGTGECRVRLKPSESFLDFASALRAWKRNGDTAVKHGCLP